MKTIIFITILLFNSLAITDSEYIEVENPIASEGSPITVNLYNLEEGAVYLFNWTLNDVGLKIVGSSVNPVIKTIELDPPTNDYSILYLRNYSTGVIIESYSIHFRHSEDIELAAIIEYLPYVGIFIFFVLVIFGIPYALLRGKKK